MISQKIAGLNLGSRNRAIAGFINVDCDKHPGVDDVRDVFDLSNYETESVGEIYASHILEHAPHLRTLDILKEWRRVIVPGGKLYVAVPDFERCVDIYNREGLNQWIVNFLMGDQGYKTAFHYALFDEVRLEKLLLSAGFSEVFRVEQFPIGDEGDCSNLAYIADGEPVSLNMIAVK